MSGLYFDGDRMVLMGRTFPQFPEYSLSDANKAMEKLSSMAETFGNVVIQNFTSSTERLFRADKHLYLPLPLKDSEKMGVHLKGSKVGDGLGFIFVGPEILLVNQPHVSASESSDAQEIFSTSQIEYDGSRFIATPKISIGFDSTNAAASMTWPPNLFRETTSETPASNLSVWKHWVEIRSANTSPMRLAANECNSQIASISRALVEHKFLEKNMDFIEELLGLEAAEKEVKSFGMNISVYTSNSTKMWTEAYSKISDAGSTIYEDEIGQDFKKWTDWISNSTKRNSQQFEDRKPNKVSVEVNDVELLWCSLEEGVSSLFGMHSDKKANFLTFCGLAFVREDKPTIMLSQRENSYNTEVSSLACFALSNQILKWI